MKNKLKSIPLWLVLFYTGFMFYKIPGIPDSIILIGLITLYGFEMFLNRQREQDVELDPEYEKLKNELDIESMRLNLEAAKLQKIKQAELIAARNEVGSNDKKFIF